MSAPIEVTTRYVTSVESLSAAWAFVMDRVDTVGERPSIHITPKSVYSWAEMGDEDARPVELFEVVVEGMVHEGGGS